MSPKHIAALVAAVLIVFGAAFGIASASGDGAEAPKAKATPAPDEAQVFKPEAVRIGADFEAAALPALKKEPTPEPTPVPQSSGGTTTAGGTGGTTGGTVTGGSTGGVTGGTTTGGGVTGGGGTTAGGGGTASGGGGTSGGGGGTSTGGGGSTGDQPLGAGGSDG